MTDRERDRRKRREAGGRSARKGSAAGGRGGRAGRRTPEEGFRPAGLGPLNLVLLGAALVCLVVGYVLLDRGSITAAPVLLVLGYAVLIPAGLLIGSRARRSESEERAGGAPTGRAGAAKQNRP